MKAALMADPRWLGLERPAFRRLMIGLVDERVQVVQVLPEWAARDRLSLAGEAVTYRDSPWAWVRQWRLRALGRQIDELEVDLIHALNGSLYTSAAALGRALNRPIVCQVWSVAELEGLTDQPSPVPVGLAAATEPLVAACKERAPAGWPVRLIRPGVYVPQSSRGPEPLSDPAHSLCALIVADLECGGGITELLQGLAARRDRLMHAQFFIYGSRRDHHECWQIARRMNLLHQVTLIEPHDSTRDLVLEADVLMVPQPMAAARTLLLESMAAGRPVITCADPDVDYLIHDQSACVIDRPNPGKWAAVLGELLDEPDKYRRLGQSARQYVQEHHSASSFVSGVLELYQQVTAPEPLPFDESASSSDSQVD